MGMHNVCTDLASALWWAQHPVYCAPPQGHPADDETQQLTQDKRGLDANLMSIQYLITVLTNVLSGKATMARSQSMYELLKTRLGYLELMCFSDGLSELLASDACHPERVPNISTEIAIQWMRDHRQMLNLLSEQCKKFWSKDAEYVSAVQSVMLGPHSNLLSELPVIVSPAEKFTAPLLYAQQLYEESSGGEWEEEELRTLAGPKAKKNSGKKKTGDEAEAAGEGGQEEEGEMEDDHEKEKAGRKKKNPTDK